MNAAGKDHPVTVSSSMNPEIRNVALPADLCDAAEKRFRAQFENVEELLGAVLRELLRDDSERMDEAERRMVEERLRNLGYL